MCVSHVEEFCRQLTLGGEHKLTYRGGVFSPTIFAFFRCCFKSIFILSYDQTLFCLLRHYMHLYT